VARALLLLLLLLWPAVPLAAHGRLLPLPPAAPAVPAGVSPRLAARYVVVYTTHGDEAYGDGTRIGAVAAAFAAALRRQGFRRVVLLPPAPGGPGALAYLRARARLAAWLWRRPLWLFDVHRDDVEPGSYHGWADGQPVARVLIVLGERNPLLWRNLGPARGLAAAAEAVAPGLLRGIYLGPGEYNQDLAPRALLLEFGNRDSPRAEVLRAATLMARAVAAAAR
jgi:stage II sporulation protein P